MGWASAGRAADAAVGVVRRASSGKMPGPYALVRPETKLSLQDIETICAAARQADADVADRRKHR